MKSSITTLAVVVFALTLTPQLCSAQESGSVVAADPLAPVVNVAPRIPADGLVRYAAAPAVLAPPPAAIPAIPAAPISYAMGGLAPTHQKTGGAKCVCLQCQRERRFSGSWGSVDYMMVWMKGRNIPALATTSPIGTPLPAAGVMPTTVLFGDDRIGDTMQSAGRVDFGLWLDDNNSRGIGVRFMGIEGDRTRFDAASTGTPILGVPFFNIDLPAEDAIEVAFPGEYRGQINDRTANNLMMGEVYSRMTVDRGCGYRIDFIGGYHVARMNDSIGIASQTEVIGLAAAPLPVGTVIDIYDSFRATNEMHGGELGIAGELVEGCWSFRSMVKMTIANNHQTVTIAGQTTADTGGGPVVTPNQGLFAQLSNIGTYERDRITYIPEVNFTLGYRVNQCLKLTAGYTFVYFPHVVLAGDHIDRVVSPTQVTARPAFTWQETDQWMQGLTFGAEWAF